MAFRDLLAGLQHRKERQKVQETTAPGSASLSFTATTICGTPSSTPGGPLAWLTPHKVPDHLFPLPPWGPALPATA